MQDPCPGLCRYGLLDRADDIAIEYLGIGNDLADCLACYGLDVEVQVVLHLVHERRNATRIMQVLHQVFARRLDIGE